MNARALIVSGLSDTIPEGIDVLAYARAIPAPPRSTVMVRVDEVTKPPNLPQGCRAYRFALVCIAARTDPTGPGDNELDALLEDVLHAVDKAPDLTWERATRAVYADASPCYEVVLTVHTIKEP
jgi:hypothetical protein